MTDDEGSQYGCNISVTNNTLILTHEAKRVAIIITIHFEGNCKVHFGPLGPRS